MRKLISKIVGLMLGLSLAAGVGVAVGSRKVGEVKAAPSTETFSHSDIVGMATAAAASISGTYSVFTITVDGIASSGFNASESVRVYKGASITISVSSGNITSATLTCTANGTTKYGPGCLTGDGWSAGTAKNGTWTGSAASFTLTASSNQARVSDFSITYEAGGGGESDTFTVSFNSNGGTSVEAITGITSGSTISQPANPTKANCAFVGWYTDSALTSAYNFSSQVTSSFTLYAKWELDLDTTGTSSDPYTVADARSAIDANLGLTNVYTTGIVFQVDSFNDKYSSITYWISDDGTSTNPLEIYSGLGIGGAAFSSINDVQVGDEVVVKGTLKKHNSTYEYDYNNELVTLTRKIAVSSLALSGTGISSNAMSIGSSDTSAHTVNVAINSDATDKVVNIAHQSGSSIFTLGSASITCNSSGAGSFTVTGTKATTGSETFRVSSNSNPTVYQDLVVTALDDSVVYHVVSFNSNGGSASPADQNVEHGTTFTFPSAGTKEHYSFAGWSSDGGTTKYAASATSPVVNGDVSYTAYWTEDAKYTVTYTAGTNGSGSFADANIYAGSYTLKAFDNLTGVSADEGYRFKNYTISGVDYAAGVEITVSSAVAVIVNFELIPDETTITTQVSSYAQANSWVNGTQYTSMVLDGYVTATVDGGGNSGKYYSNNSSWRLYSSESATLTISVNGDKTLSSIVLTFLATDSPTVQFNQEDISSGSYVDVTGETSAVFTVTAGKAHITEISVTYVGSGSSAESHTITYNSNGGTGGSMNPTVGSNPEVAGCGFTKDGYTFVRWNTQADGEGDDYAVGTTVSVDVTLYAIWQENIAPIGADVTMTGTTEAASASVNEHDAVKCGTGKAAGAMKLTLTKANITKIKVYIAGWNNDTGSTINVEINNSASIAMNGEPVSSITVAHDSGIANNSPFTLSGDEADYKFVFDISNNAPAGTEIVFTAANASKNRFVVWGATNLFAETFASEFASNLTCDVSGEDGPSFASGYNWASFESIYNGLDEEEQGRLHDATFTVEGSGSFTVVTATGETSQSVAEAIARYDYIIAKYGTSGYTNFIGRTVNKMAPARMIGETISSSSSTIIIVVVALTSITSIGVLLVIKRKRSLVK